MCAQTKIIAREISYKYFSMLYVDDYVGLTEIFEKPGDHNKTRYPRTPQTI